MSEKPPLYRLFVGGPADGRFLQLPGKVDVVRVLVDISGPPGIPDEELTVACGRVHYLREMENHAYMAVPVYAGGERDPIAVMVHEGLHRDDVLPKLIHGYAVRKGEKG